MGRELDLAPILPLFEKFAAYETKRTCLYGVSRPGHRSVTQASVLKAFRLDFQRELRFSAVFLRHRYSSVLPRKETSWTGNTSHFTLRTSHYGPNTIPMLFRNSCWVAGHSSEEHRICFSPFECFAFNFLVLGRSVIVMGKDHMISIHCWIQGCWEQQSSMGSSFVLPCSKIPDPPSITWSTSSGWFRVLACGFAFRYWYVASFRSGHLNSASDSWYLKWAASHISH